MLWKKPPSRQSIKSSLLSVFPLHGRCTYWASSVSIIKVEIPTTTSIIPCSTRPRRKSFEARITAFLVASALSGTLCKIHYNLFNIVEKYTDFVVINCLLLSTTIMFALDLLFDYLVCKGQGDSNDEEEEREHKICKGHAVPRWVADGRNKATNIIHNDHKLSFLHGDHILSEFYSAMKYIN